MAAPGHGGAGVEHLDLLRAARSVQRAAVDADVDAVHDRLCELRNALVAHLRDEREDQERSASDLHARLTRHGQERLVTFLDQVLAESRDDGEEGCSCLVRAAEVRAILVRQVRLEGGLRPGGR